jgi:hypothetical protein
MSPLNSDRDFRRIHVPFPIMEMSRNIDNNHLEAKREILRKYAQLVGGE